MGILKKLGVPIFFVFWFSPMAKTTKLEAVNTILSVIGEAPVNSLTPPGFPAASMALAVLEEVNRAVQTQGWNFNTETDVELTPNVDKEIPLADNILEIDSIEGRNLIEKQGKLFDKDNNTFLFDDVVKVEWTLLYDFEEIPEAARQYIMIRAARVFQARQVGSEVINGFTEQDELRALVGIRRHQTRSLDSNLLSGSEFYANTSRYRR